jgi:hypothetical protein
MAMLSNARRATQEIPISVETSVSYSREYGDRSFDPSLLSRHHIPSLKAPRTCGRGTSIGAAMKMGAALVATSGFEATRRATIDISGDGPNNMGRAVAEVRDRVVARGGHPLPPFWRAPPKKAP